MKIEIENIDTVYWKLEALANNLFINEEDKALEICAEHTDSYKFTNTHQKAKKEVRYLAINKCYDVLDSYYEKYKYLFDNIKETCSKYENKFLRTQVNIHLIPTLEFFDEIKKFSTIVEVKIDNLSDWENYEKFYDLLITSTNEGKNKPIDIAYWILKEAWFFTNSDNATMFDLNKSIEKDNRPMYLKGIFIGEKQKFDKDTNVKITYCSTQNNINLKEQDFIISIKEWIENKLKNSNLSVVRKRKYAEFLTYLEDNSQPNQIEEKQEPPVEHLKDLFKDKNLYDKVIDILIGENYIEKGTLIWKDETGGKRGFVAGLIKVLYNKGYLSRGAKNREIPIISKNTFKVDLSQSIAEKTRVNENEQNYKFIPISSDLKQKMITPIT